MRILAIVIATALGFSGGATFAQSSGTSVRVHPGHFCWQNKCVRFNRDLQSVSIQGRRPVSVASYGLRTNPVISSEAFREIFRLALRQNGVGADR